MWLRKNQVITAPLIFEQEIKLLSGQIMEKLFSVYSNNRFQTSLIKKYINNLDIFLGKVYNLDDEEINYLLNYDGVVRNKYIK